VGDAVVLAGADAVVMAEADAVVMAEGAPSLLRPEGSMAAGDARTAVGDITAVARIMADGDITVQDLDSGCTRLTAMRLPCAILQGSMMPTASGSIIQVARFRTDIESQSFAARLAAGRPAIAGCCWCAMLPSIQELPIVTEGSGYESE